MKKKLLLSTTMGLLAIGALSAPAQATEDRITVSELHSFVSQLDGALNARNIELTKHELDLAISDRASFDSNIATPTYNHDYWRANANGYNPYYYRYPYNSYAPHYRVSNYRTLSKWEQINLVTNKKMSIPGYQANLDVTDTEIRPYGEEAVIDIDLKEYGMSYLPHTYNYVQKNLQAYSKCKVYVIREGRDNLKMQRMDCNTNSSL